MDPAKNCHELHVGEVDELQGVQTEQRPLRRLAAGLVVSAMEREVSGL